MYLLQTPEQTQGLKNLAKRINVGPEKFDNTNKCRALTDKNLINHMKQNLQTYVAKQNKTKNNKT